MVLTQPDSLGPDGPPGNALETKHPRTLLRVRTSLLLWDVANGTPCAAIVRHVVPLFP
jgi:hypothetical protein